MKLARNGVFLAEVALHPEELRMEEWPSDYHQRWWPRWSRDDVDHVRL